MRGESGAYQRYSLTASTLASVPVQVARYIQEVSNNFAVMPFIWHGETLPDISIEKGFLITPSDSEYKAQVLQSFRINLKVVKGEFIATSSISDLYEPGESAGKAALHYLYSLLDEMVWLQDNEEDLSASLLEVLKNLRLYVKLM